MAAPEASAPRGSLRGVGVLITRPAHQAESLARLIEQAGGTAIRFPTIEIAPPADPRRMDAILDRLTAYDLAVFVSPNAVERTFARLGGREWPEHVAVACVGAATARLLAAHGVHALAPTDRFDSESLLALPAMQQAAGKQVLILRGDGGRELLAETLRQRGATVTYLECYRRLRPRNDPNALHELWNRGEVSIVSITSSEGLRNLHAMLDDAGRAQLARTPVVVLSQAQARQCRELDIFTEPLIAPEASDEAILKTIQAWRHPGFSL